MEAEMVFTFGIVLTVLLEVGEITIEDVGIGPYEYHGGRFSDSRMELTEAQCDSIKVWSDRRKEFVIPSLNVKEHAQETMFDYPELVDTLEKFAGEWEEGELVSHHDHLYEQEKDRRMGL
jgi:hypothetical protein